MTVENTAPPRLLVLDTDHLSWLQKPVSRQAGAITARLLASRSPVAVTVVSLEEQLRGRLAECAAAKTVERYMEALRLLRLTYEDYRPRTLLDFDDRAAAEFKRLKAAKVRIGTNDLRIAAIVLAHDALLLTRNLTDFRRVPRLRAEDWSA